MQDIAGCRIVVTDILMQNSVVAMLTAQLKPIKIFDRRERPSHGYRAVHLIAHCADRPIEIQIRSLIQHRWAEVSEKLADVIDPAIKYGGGPEQVQLLLSNMSTALAAREQIDVKFQKLKDDFHDQTDLIEIEVEIEKLDRRLDEFIKLLDDEISS